MTNWYAGSPRLTTVGLVAVQNCSGLFWLGRGQKNDNKKATFVNYEGAGSSARVGTAAAAPAARPTCMTSWEARQSLGGHLPPAGSAGGRGGDQGGRRGGGGEQLEEPPAGPAVEGQPLLRPSCPEGRAGRWRGALCGWRPAGLDEQRETLGKLWVNPGWFVAVEQRGRRLAETLSGGPRGVSKETSEEGALKASPPAYVGKASRSFGPGCTGEFTAESTYFGKNRVKEHQASKERGGWEVI